MTALEGWLLGRFKVAPPIVKQAVFALLHHEDTIDPMGYDLSYYQEDLPRVVAEAIAPWKDG